MNPTVIVTAPGDLEIVMTRLFDAPRHLVFAAMSKPEYLRRWLLGPDGWAMTACEFDARPGGRYRYEWKHSDGATMGVGGTFLEVVPPERIVQSEKFDESRYPGEAIVTTTFEEAAEQTTLAVTIRYETREARDGVLKSPMESGLAKSYDRLAEIVQQFCATNS
jgi:uncharacterized protein YndB with AHSA1/START domain